MKLVGAGVQVSDLNMSQAAITIVVSFEPCIFHDADPTWLPQRPYAFHVAALRSWCAAPQIANIELISKDRMPFKGLDVIYCILPTLANISMVHAACRTESLTQCSPCGSS